MGNKPNMLSSTDGVSESYQTEEISEIVQSLINDLSISHLLQSIEEDQIQWSQGDLIGRGSHTQVFQCINQKTGNFLAVKRYNVITNQLRKGRSKAVSQFNRLIKQVQTLRFLDHPNIIKLHQVQISQDKLSVDLLIELVAGGSLKSLIHSYRGLDEIAIGLYGCQLLDVLEYLHQMEIVHRDLKPDNILIGTDGSLKVIDFGSSGKGRCQSWKGSPYWIAPEIVQRKKYGTAADIWSFGCILIEMVGGKLPWEEYSTDPNEVLSFIASPGYLPRIPDCSKELKKVIQSCLQRNPNKRPNASCLLKN